MGFCCTVLTNLASSALFASYSGICSPGEGQDAEGSLPNPFLMNLLMFVRRSTWVLVVVRTDEASFVVARDIAEQLFSLVN